MLKKSPHGLRLMEKYSHIQCTQCFRKLPGVYQCGNCEDYFCPDCETTEKIRIMTAFYLHTGDPVGNKKKCNGQFTFACKEHSDRKPSKEMDRCPMFDHLVGEMKCSNAACRAKRFCPRCKIMVKYQYCVDCTTQSLFCKPCITDRQELAWSECVSDDDAPTNPWQIVFPDRKRTDSFNSGRVKYLCGLDQIARIPWAHQESDQPETRPPEKKRQSIFPDRIFRISLD